MRRKYSFKISITAFIALSSALLLGVLLAVGLGTLSSMRVVGEKAAEVRQVNLPEVAEAQRFFSNIERLRHLAETVYISENAQYRRAARLRAQALATGTVFTHNPDFYEKTLNLSAIIAELAASRDVISANSERLRSLEFEFVQTVFSIGAYLPRQKTRLLEAYQEISFSRLEELGGAPDAGNRLRDLLEANAGPLARIQEICRANVGSNPALPALYARLLDFEAQFRGLVQVQGENLDQAHALWTSVDATLREMRDALSTGAEFDSLDSLHSIEESVDRASLITTALLAAGGLFLLVYLLLMLWGVVRPVRWAGHKLREIQQGHPESQTPPIAVAELFEVAQLLDRFSLHLARLTSQASQLAEDAAEKEDLEMLMAALFQVSVDGYFIWNPQELFSANGALLRLLGLADVKDFDERWEVMGFIPRGRHLHRFYDEVLERGFLRRERYVKTASGEELPLEISYLPIRRRGTMCVLSYLRDLRQQKSIEAALRVARDNAETAAQAKSDFLARMSHEIRTPMNGVLGLAHLAMESDPPPRQREYLEKIQASARILLHVINDILDFSKMESGRFTLERRNFSFAKMLNTVVDLFSAQAQERNLRFVLETDPALPANVAGDELRLAQVLINLCGNAMKFTEKGEVVLSVLLQPGSGEVAAKGPTGNTAKGLAKSAAENVPAKPGLRVRFSVRDTGVGMTEGQLANLFQPFTQGDSSTTRKYGGSGLGLVISKTIVEMMDGKISVVSHPGQGSIFSFDVLLEEADGDLLEDPHQDAEIKPWQLGGRRVLLVEDNEINQEIAVSLLRSLGCVPFVANNGAEALEILAEQDVECVLMDIQMPVMDGFTATRNIREQARVEIRGLPIIAMTARAMQEDREKSLAAGMNDHLNKPIDVAQLRETLVRWAGRW